MTQVKISDSPRAATGIAGLDEILGGGLPRQRLFLVHGRPGSGKTTLALQYLIEGARTGEPGVYVGLSETEAELREIAASHGWSLEGVEICDVQSSEMERDSDSEYTFFHPSEIELNETIGAIIEVLERIRPRRVVFDSLSELRLMARDSLRYRRQILALKGYFVEHDTTAIFLDTRLSEVTGEFQLETLAHGVMSIEQEAHDYGGSRRRLRVEKLRGVSYLEGHHDLRIRTGGIEVYPRLVAPPEDPSGAAQPDLLATGNEHLDRMLGGGLQWGSTAIVLGPSGVGKTTIASVATHAALAQGHAATVYLFDEGVDKWLQRAHRLGMTDSLQPAEGLRLRHVNPAELTPGELAHEIRQEVDRGVRVVVLDSINGYRSAMPDEGFLTLHLHELLSYLNQKEVITVLVAAQHGFLGDNLDDPGKLSYLADSVVLLRYFEAFGRLRKAVTMIKNRTGEHDRSIRELLIDDDGAHVGDELRDFQGVLGGELIYSGREERLLDGADRP